LTSIEQTLHSVFVRCGRVLRVERELATASVACFDFSRVLAQVMAAVSPVDLDEDAMVALSGRAT
jgi:hypothetical protein